MCAGWKSPHYATGESKITTLMGVAECATYGGQYPGTHTFQGNATTVEIASSPTVGYFATSTLVDLVFMCGGVETINIITC